MTKPPSLTQSEKDALVGVGKAKPSRYNRYVLNDDPRLKLSVFTHGTAGLVPPSRGGRDRFLNSEGHWVEIDTSSSASSSSATGVGEQLVDDFITSPPSTLYNDDGTDWLYEDIA